MSFLKGSVGFLVGGGEDLAIHVTPVQDSFYRPKYLYASNVETMHASPPSLPQKHQYTQGR